MTEALRREETNRGLTFEYCLITAGTTLNRAPSEQVWGEGDILSLDSGGNYHGYIGDLCRMAIHGEPDAELEDMLADIEEIQRASMKPIKAGAMGSEVYAVGRGAARQVEVPQQHALPRPRHGAGQPRGAAAHRDRPGARTTTTTPSGRSETGMVISVETTLAHPKRGFIKLEDTVVVTATGCDIYGEGARGWNRGGTAAARLHPPGFVPDRAELGPPTARPGTASIWACADHPEYQAFALKPA